MRLHIILVIAAVLLAGCGGAVQEETTTATTTVGSTTTETTPTETPTEQPESTSTRTPTETETETPTTVLSPPDNPWQTNTVTVQVVNNANKSRDFEALVRQALSYWENRSGSPYHDPVNYTIDPDNHLADVQITFVENITECGYSYSVNTTLGCADTIPPDVTVEEQVEVEIAAGFTNNSTLETLKHEIGHTRGYEHGDEPHAVMKAMQNATTWEEKQILAGLSQHPYPWPEDTLTVYVDSDNTLSHTEDDQVDHALSYYEAGADGWIENAPQFERIENESVADIQININDEEYEGCMEEQAEEKSTCGVYWNTTIQGQSYYTEYQMNINGYDDEVVGWLIGYRLGSALGADSPEDLPEVFQDGDNARDSWWN